MTIMAFFIIVVGNKVDIIIAILFVGIIIDGYNYYSGLSLLFEWSHCSLFLLINRYRHTIIFYMKLNVNLDSWDSDFLMTSSMDSRCSNLTKILRFFNEWITLLVVELCMKCNQSIRTRRHTCGWPSTNGEWKSADVRVTARSARETDRRPASSPAPQRTGRCVLFQWSPGPPPLPFQMPARLRQSGVYLPRDGGPRQPLCTFAKVCTSLCLCTHAHALLEHTHECTSCACTDTCALTRGHTCTPICTNIVCIYFNMCVFMYTYTLH